MNKTALCFIIFGLAICQVQGETSTKISNKDSNMNEAKKPISQMADRYVELATDANRASVPNEQLILRYKLLRNIFQFNKIADKIEKQG